MVIWRPRPASFWRCRFEYENPEPEPPFIEGQDLCEREWLPYITCDRRALVRVELDDGRYFDTCSLRAHGVDAVRWWAPVVSVIPEFQFTQAMKYLYRAEAVGELAMCDHPFFQLLPRAGAEGLTRLLAAYAKKEQ